MSKVIYVFTENYLFFYRIAKLHNDITYGSQIKNSLLLFSCLENIVAK